MSTDINNTMEVVLNEEGIYTSTDTLQCVPSWTNSVDKIQSSQKSLGCCRLHVH